MTSEKITKVDGDTRWRFRIFTGRDDPESMDRVSAIRIPVFTGEQGFCVGHDPDELDPEALQLLITDKDDGDLAVATCRVSPFVGEPTTARIGRVAVKQTHRGCGLGIILLRQAVREARRLGFGGAIIHGQVQAQAFYEKAGFRPVGEEYLSEGRQHRRMRMTFQD